jgi:hypothetical protein
MKKQNAFVTWLLYGRLKKAALSRAIAANAPTAATLEALVPLTTAPLAAVPVVPEPAAHVHAAPVPIAAVPIATVPDTPVPATTRPADHVPVATYSFVGPVNFHAPKLTSDVGDEYEDFILYMKSGKRPFRKPGMTVKQEFDAWLAHRVKTSQAEAAAAAARGKTQVRAHA